MDTDKACCFFGHRKIDKTPELIERLTSEIETLITEKEVSIFYFGSKSEFDDFIDIIRNFLRINYYLSVKKIFFI